MQSVIVNVTTHAMKRIRERLPCFGKTSDGHLQRLLDQSVPEAVCIAPATHGRRIAGVKLGNGHLCYLVLKRTAYEINVITCLTQQMVDDYVAAFNRRAARGFKQNFKHRVHGRRSSRRRGNRSERNHQFPDEE